MTSQTKTISIIVLAMVLAVGLSLLGLGLSGVLFKGGETVQTGTGGTEAAAVAPTEGGETSVFPVIGPDAVTTEDIALISQGEPVAALLETPAESLDFIVGQAVPVEGAVSLSVPSELPSLTPDVLDLIGYETQPVVTPLPIMEVVLPDPNYVGDALISGPTGNTAEATQFTSVPLEVVISDDPAALDVQSYANESELLNGVGNIHIVTYDGSMAASGDFTADETEYFMIVSPDQVLSPDNAALVASVMPVITIPYGDKVIVITYDQYYGESAMDFSY